MRGDRTTGSWAPGARPRRAGALLMVLLLGAVLTACGGPGGTSGGSQVTLRYSWWGNPDRAARTNEAVALFQRKHPGIEVQTSFAGYDAYKQKLATQAAGGDAPDVMQLDYRMIDQYATGGVLLDLSSQPVVRTEEIDPGLLATGAVGGVQYALVQARGTEAVVYDAKAWRAAGVAPPRAGWSWEEWARSMRELTARTGKPGSVDPGQSEDCFEVWLRGRGKSLYTEGGGLGFTAADLERWWSFADGLRREGVVSPAEQTTQLDGSVENTPLGRGTALSDFNWDAPSSGFTALVADGVTLAPMPGGEDGTPGQYFKPSMFMGVSAHTEHPEEAASLVDFMINDKDAAKILGASRGIPVNESIRTELVPQLKDFDRTVADYQASVEQVLKAPPQAPPSGDSALQTTFSRDYDQVSFGRMSPREAAENYVTEAKAELR
ncbi:ABC transporter substrate-binding protein [Streptomyces sp. NPDC093085]|uniref:ABC transporter substrate-binding protein n=1 Tax=Streptomyces sp. NPDC093085 TaxID=3155068 RepID=UPI003431BABF